MPAVPVAGVAAAVDAALFPDDDFLENAIADAGEGEPFLDEDEWLIGAESEATSKESSRASSRRPSGIDLCTELERERTPCLPVL